MRFHFLLLLELRVAEISKLLLEFLDAFRKSLHNLIKIREQLILIRHSRLELDDAFFHAEILASAFNPRRTHTP